MMKPSGLAKYAEELKKKFGSSTQPASGVMSTGKQDTMETKTNTKVICHYCGNEARLVGGEVIYPHRIDLFEKKFWLCDPCDAYVGCHHPHPKYGKTGTEPLGILANAKLRKLKSQAHAAFDPLWREKKKFKSRTDAYYWLAKEMKMNTVECHIGMFDEDLCLIVIMICEKYN